MCALQLYRSTWSFLIRYSSAVRTVAARPVITSKSLMRILFICVRLRSRPAPAAQPTSWKASRMVTDILSTSLRIAASEHETISSNRTSKAVRPVGALLDNPL
ncbi:hypothetical protein BJX99DRAFT_229938 [Aspergillus californicus]